MKHSWKAPPALQALSYRVFPSRRRVVRLLNELRNSSLDLSRTQEFIIHKLRSGEPFLLGRPGGTESEGVYFFLHKRLGSRRPKRQPYSAWFRKYSQIQAGVTHHRDSDLDYFNTKYLESILSSDMLAYGQFAPGSLGIVRTMSELGKPITHFDSLEPWVSMRENLAPWTTALEGKRVLIVHPFVESISAQLEKKSQITGVKDFLPDFSYEIISPPVTFAGEKTTTTWACNLRNLVDTVGNKDFDVALIGAGSYGLPLGSYIRATGRQALHLGGVTQLLFGIGGGRWGESGGPSGMADSTWIRPNPAERPSGHHLVEGGAYW